MSINSNTNTLKRPLADNAVVPESAKRARHVADEGRAFATLPTEEAAQDPSSLLKPRHVKELEDRGFTVVEGVLDANDCARIKQEWLATMDSYQGSAFDSMDRSTWKGNNLPANIRGMQNWPPVAQEWWVWETRLKTAPVFATLWGCAETDLIASMDRVCFVPFERLRLNAGNKKGWAHLDQSRLSRRGTLQCVQGFVTLNAIGAGEVALQVYAGAHKYHAQFFEERIAGDAKRAKDCANGDWCKLDESGDDRAWYMRQDGVQEVRVHAQPGSLVLWDSRLPHHAMPPSDNGQRSQIDRYVIYSCMVPRQWAAPRALEKRIAAHEKGCATPHWPHDGKTFPYKPRVYSADSPLFEPQFDPKQHQLQVLPEKVSDYSLLRRLVGYE